MVEKIGKVGTFFSNTKCNPQKNSKYFFCQKREKFAKSGHTKKRQRKKNVYVNWTETRFYVGGHVVWPDWAIFKAFGKKVFYKRYRKFGDCWSCL